MSDENQNIFNNGVPPPEPKPKAQAGARAKKRRSKAGRSSAHSPELSVNSITSHLTPAFLLHVFRRWWLVVSPVGLVLAALVAGALWYSFQPIYKAIAWVQIQDRRPHIAFQGAMDSGRFVQTQLELIRSPLVLSSALSRPEVARMTQVVESSNPLAWISTNVEVKSVGGSDLYQISFKDSDPIIAAKIADAIMDAYLELQNTRTSQQIEEIVRLLEEEKGRRVGELEQLREKTRALYAKVYPHAPTLPAGSKGEHIPAASPLAKEQDQLTASEVERAFLEARLKAYQKLVVAEKIEVPVATVDRAVEDSPEVQKLMVQLSTKRADQKEFQHRSAKGAQDQHVQRLAKEIQDLEQRLQKAREELQPRITEDLQASFRKEREEAAALMQTRIKSQQVLEEILQERIVTKRQELEQGADRSLEFEFARADLQRAEKVFTNISDRILMLRTEKEALLRQRCYNVPFRRRTQ